MAEQTNDGVRRDGLDYRAGWCEALRALGTAIKVNGVRCRKGEVAGLELAHRLAADMHQAMIDRMKGEGASS